MTAPAEGGHMGALSLAPGGEDDPPGEPRLSRTVSKGPQEGGQAAPAHRGKLGWLHKVFRAQPSDARVDIAFVVLAAVVYGVLVFAMGSEFLPGHAAWATLLLWASSQIGAFIAHQVYLPRVIGMLCAGMLMRNVPWGAIDAFPATWGTQMRAGALATIFLRCGLELDFATMRRFKYPALRLALLPGLVEAFYDGSLGVAIYGMPVLLAFTMGFILKAVGPGLVVPAMFKLQKTGLGKDQGIPSTVVIAASFDDIVAITGYSIFSALAITGNGNLAWQIASGPAQVVFGIAGGLLAGFALGCTRLFDTRLKRVVGTYGAALLVMFFLEYYKLLSGGALGSLIVGLVASNAWEQGVPKCASLGRSFAFSPEIERTVGLIWVWVMEPMLFVTIGSSINFSTLQAGTIPRALLIVGTGVTLRVLVTFLVMMGFGYTTKEKVFYALAWTPKATVQAALSAAPLALIEQNKVGEPNYDEWVKWGNDILTTGIFAIILCGTLGVMAIHFTAPLLLEPAAVESEDEDGNLSPASGDAPASAVYDAAKGGAALTSLTASVDADPSAAVGTFAAAPGGAAPSALRSRSQNNLPLGLSSYDSQHPQPEDYELVAEFIDAIRMLTAAVTTEPANKEDVRRMSDHVMQIQRRIETEIGRREPSVRELFRTATRLAVKRPAPFLYRAQSQAGLSAGAGPSHLQQRAGGGAVGGAGLGMRWRSEDPSAQGSRPPTPGDIWA